MKKFIIFVSSILLVLNFIFQIQIINAQTAKSLIFRRGSEINSLNINDISESDVNNFTYQWSYPLSGESLRADENDNIYFYNSNQVYKLDWEGNLLFQRGSSSGTIYAIAVKPNGDFVESSGNNGFLQMWSADNSTFLVGNYTNYGRASSMEFDNAGNLYVGYTSRVIRKFNSSFQLVWTSPSIGGSSQNLPNNIVYDDLDHIYVSGQEGTIYKININTGAIVGSVVYGIDLYGLSYSNNHIYAGGQITNGNARIRKYDLNLNLVWSSANYSGRILHLATDIDGNAYATGSLGLLSVDSNSNTIAFTPYTSGSFTGSIAVIYQPEIPPVEYPLEINLTSNYNPFADIIYESNFLTTTSSIVNDILTTDSAITVSSLQVDISPFDFLHWWDIDNQSVFTTNREFVIESPTRDYNLEAVYDLTNSINLSLNSNLPSPPNFNIEVDTIEGQRAFINKYPLINEEIPFGYNFIIEAPVDTVGPYIFDYWYDNENNRPFTNSAIVSLDALENYNLTAVYSLPEEYQINLVLQVPVGFIIFQHGNLPPISGPFISATIGLGDSWTATAPLNEDYRFLEWYDLDNNLIESFTRSISIGSTNRNYFLEAIYQEVVTINWDTLGGTAINSFKVDRFTNYNAPSINPIKPAFAFGGWALPSAPNTPITFPQFASQSITYQAIWIPTYTLTFNSNGGTLIPVQEIIQNELPTLVTPSRFGYTFEGWFTDNVTFNNAFDFNQPFTQNTIVHAKWEFGTAKDAEVSLNSFFTDAGLDNPIAQWIIVLALFIFLNVMIFIYKGPFIVTIILNFILTALFIVLGFIPIWITIIIFIALFGFGILMFTGGRS